MLGALALATATVPFLGVSPAAADEATIAPSTTGYFYAGAIRKPDESPAAPPNLTGDHTDGVAKGNLAVAAEGGQEEKVSFLLFDLLDVVPGSVVSKATLTLPLVDNAPPENVSYGQDAAKVRACASGDEGFNGDDGVSMQDAPSRKCDVFSAPAKAIITGDVTQIDLPPKVKSGLEKSARILRNIEGIGHVELDEEDVVRHKLVKAIIKAYDKERLKELEDHK
jgi:hypothetical protein